MGTQHRHTVTHMTKEPWYVPTLKKKKSLAEYSSEYNAIAVKELGGSINLLMRFSVQALSLPVGNNYI